jgi:hypothetical protein
LGLGRRSSRPSAEDATKRLLVLKHIVVSALSAPPREMLREISVKWSADEQREFEQRAEKGRDQLWQGLRDLGLWSSLSPKEKALAESTMATMTQQQQVDSSWRVEAAQALMWALRMLPEMPPYDRQAPPELLKQVPSQDVKALLKSARLRDQAEIDRARDNAEFWHWRSRTRELIEKGDELRSDEKMKAVGFRSYDDIVRFSAIKAAEEGTIPPCIDKDFPAKGKAYRDLSEEEWSEVRSTTVERHFALNWLCGYAPGNRWDETPTDT